MYKIIDGHVHLFTEKLMQAILNWFEKNEGWVMPFKWDTQKHIEYLHKIGVSEFMVLGYAHKTNISRDINQWLSDLAEKYPEVKAYACIHQDDLDKGALLKPFLDRPSFFGVKIHSYVQKVSAADLRFKEVYHLLSEKRKGLILHASSMPISTHYTTPVHVEELLKEYPDMRIMVAHLGLPEFHKEYLKLTERYDNLYLDTAYLFGNPKIKSELLKDTLKNYADKIVFGSDFPIMDYPPEMAIQQIRSFNFGEEAERKIFYSNARKFMGITG